MDTYRLAVIEGDGIGREVVPEGLAALMAYDPEADAPANARAMRSAAAGVVTGEAPEMIQRPLPLDPPSEDLAETAS